MPAYLFDPNASRPLLTPGKYGHSAGSRRLGPNVRMQVTKSAVSANVVTLTVQIFDGLIPTVGETAFVTGTQNNAGALNQPNGVALTGVSISTATGAGTITYALTTGNLATTADTGLVTVPPGENSDALTAATAYLQHAVQQPSGMSTSGRTVSWSTIVGGAPASVNIRLQAALRDVDSEYFDLDISTNTSGEERFLTNIDAPWLRVKCVTVSGGTNPSLIAKILV